MMTHRPLYVKKHHHWFLLTSVLVAAVALWYFCSRFNPQKIIDQSELKNRNFVTNVQEITSPKSGIKAYFLQESTNPIVAIYFTFEGAGSVADPQKMHGLSNLTAQMLLEGAGDLNSQNFKEELENYAIEIDYDNSLDDFSGHMLTTKENLPRAKKLLHNTLMSPLLENKDLQRIKQQTITYINNLQEKPSEQLKRKISKIVFENHPYSVSALGEKDGILTVGAEDIRNFVAKNLAKDNIYVGIAGDLSKEDAEKLLDDVFGEIAENNSVKAPDMPKVEFLRKRTDIDENLPQVITGIVAKGVERTSREFYPLYIANYIFGGSGLNSRINQSAREKEGLTYGAYTTLALYKQAPLLVGEFSTTPKNFERMQQIFVEEWNKMGEQGVSPKELASAKKYLISSHNLRFSSVSAIAEILAYMQKEKLGKDFLKKRNSYVENVTLEQVNIAAKKYFSAQTPIIVNYGLTSNKEDKHEKEHK